MTNHKTDIILAGVGGQGILSIATVIGAAALRSALNIKQSEVHGMSQRGGDVQANLRLSPQTIASDLIPLNTADLIISNLSADGWIVTAAEPLVNIPNYPNIEIVLSELKSHDRVMIVDAEKIASSLSNAKGANMVLLGAASQYINIEWEKLQDGLRDVFASKGQAVVEANLVALEAGRAQNL